MAYIDSYISTTSTSELASFFAEAAELSTAQHEFIIKESYYKVNEVLDSFIQTPLPKQPTTGLYPSAVREAQAALAIYYARRLILGTDSELTERARAAADLAIKELLDGKAQIEQMYSQDEIGIQYPVPGSSNTSTAILQVDRSSTYTGDTERIYTFTATSSADIGTATMSWGNGEGDTGTFTSDYAWDSIEDGLIVRFMASPSGGVSIVSGNTWKVRCTPYQIKPDVPGNYISLIPVRNG